MKIENIYKSWERNVEGEVEKEGLRHSHLNQIEGAINIQAKSKAPIKNRHK